jgi:hypothetical protein
MHVIFIITSWVSLIFVIYGIDNLADNQTEIDQEMWVMRTCLAIAGLLMSASWFILYHLIYRLRKRLDALSATVRGLRPPAGDPTNR